MKTSADDFKILTEHFQITKDKPNNASTKLEKLLDLVCIKGHNLVFDDTTYPISIYPYIGSDTEITSVKLRTLYGSDKHIGYIDEVDSKGEYIQTTVIIPIEDGSSMNEDLRYEIFSRHPLTCKLANFD